MGEVEPQDHDNPWDRCPDLITVVTEHGSTYVLDGRKKLWLRRSTPQSSPLRSNTGHFWHIDRLEVGKPMRLICPPWTRQARARLIETTPVVSIQREEQPDDSPDAASRGGSAD